MTDPIRLSMAFTAVGTATAAVLAQADAHFLQMYAFLCLYAVSLAVVIVKS